MDYNSPVVKTAGDQMAGPGNLALLKENQDYRSRLEVNDAPGTISDKNTLL
jgi:hypothetical protein